MERKNQKGFTIVEMMIIIVILAILGFILFPLFSKLISTREKINATNRQNTEVKIDQKTNSSVKIQKPKHWGYIKLGLRGDSDEDWIQNKMDMAIARFEEEHNCTIISCNIDKDQLAYTTSAYVRGLLVVYWKTNEKEVK